MKSLPEATVPSRDPGALSPRLFSGGRVVGALVVILALLAGVLFITRAHQGTSTSPRTNQPSATFALTDPQAVATFRKLNRIRIQAYVRRDPSLVPLMAMANSPAARTAIREIHKLKVDSVIPKPRFRTKSLTVTKNTASQILIRQVFNYDLRFTDEHGRDVTASNKRQRQVVVWTIRQSGQGEWRIFDAVITASRPLISR
jgi:hypothetical protein